MHTVICCLPGSSITEKVPSIVTTEPTIVYPDADSELAALLKGRRRERLEALGGFAIHHGRPAGDEDFLARIASARGLLLGWALPTNVMRRAPRLEVVAFTGTGAANFIDLDAAVEAGIIVTNTPGYADNAVAEHALALLLAVARRVPFLDRRVRDGHWEQPQGFELRGRTLGLIGFGGIAARFAEIAHGLGMEVVAWTRRADPERARRHGIRFVDLDDVLQADVVSLHLPLTEEMRGFLGPAELDRLRSDAVFINTARGELVDEPALIARLRDGRIAAAGLDVFQQEPLPADHPLTSLENVVLTPHAGFSTPEAVANLLDIAIGNLEAYFAGRPVNIATGPAQQDQDRPR